MSFSGVNIGQSKVFMGAYTASVSAGVVTGQGIGASSIAIPFAGSLAGLCLTSGGANVGAGTIGVLVYDYTSASYLNSSGLFISSGGQANASYAPGLYTFNAGDYLQIQYSTTLGFVDANTWTFAYWVYI